MNSEPQDNLQDRLHDNPQDKVHNGAAGSANLPPDLSRGLAYLKAEVRKLSGDPGVYRMLNGVGEALYVGKARNLARRVTSYTQPNRTLFCTASHFCDLCLKNCQFPCHQAITQS